MLSKRVCLRAFARFIGGALASGRGRAHLLEQVCDEGRQVLGVGRRFCLHRSASPPRVFQLGSLFVLRTISRDREIVDTIWSSAAQSRLVRGWLAYLCYEATQQTMRFAASIIS